LQVKTTAPKEYCVRPNSGKLSPGASIDINVMLQPPMPKEGTKSKDKFLVQTVYEKEVEDSNHPDMVKHPAPDPFARGKTFWFLLEIVHRGHFFKRH